MPGRAFPPPKEREARFAGYIAATERADTVLTADCALPVVCTCDAGCWPGANATLAGAEPACAWKLPTAPLPVLPATNASVIVEVGSNKLPESSRLPRRVGRYTVVVEPLRFEGNTLWQDGLATVLVAAAAAPTRGRGTLSVETTMSSLVSATLSNAVANDSARRLPPRTQPTPLVPLAEVLEAYVPLPAGALAVHPQTLIIDAQGHDLDVALSAGPHIHRFDYIIFECQELPPEHILRYNPASPVCSEIIVALREKRGLALVGCMRNVALSEFNCLMVPPNGSVALRYGAEPPSVVVDGGNGNTTAAPTASDGAAWWEGRATGPRRYPDVPPPEHGIAALVEVTGSPADAVELAFLLCPVLGQPHRAARNCWLHGEADLRATLDPSVYCPPWRCRVLARKDRPKCLAARSARCRA